MKETHIIITKKWSRKGKVLRSIIHGFFSADDKVHNNGGCMELQKEKDFDVGKPSFNYNVFRVSLNRGLKGLRKIGRVVSMRKVVKEEEEVELCKKRIIMGKKCRPLNLSGALRYDNHGILVPEDLF